MRCGRLLRAATLCAAIASIPTRAPAAARAQSGAARADSAGADSAGADSAGADSAGADSPGADSARRSVRGRVVRPGRRGMLPVAHAWVTLHRVGPDAAGPVDSGRTAGDGGYAFDYRATGSARAVYFVSSSYAGIAYFSQPLRAARATGDAAEITVFDTTSGPLELHVRGRHLIVSASGPERTRSVIEVFELSNDSSLTLVARGAGDGPGAAGGAPPTWSTAVPREARDFAVGQGDIAADAVALRDGRVQVFAPFAPGLKQISFSYTLPATAFPLGIPVARATSVFEVLLEDPRASVAGPKLAEVNPVSIDGRTFRRFLAQDPPSSGVVRVDVPAPPDAPGRRYVRVVLLAVLLLMLVALALAFRRGRTAAAMAPAPWRDAEQLARAIAALDDHFESEPEPSESSRATYEQERRLLKAELSAALAVDERRV